MNESPFDLGKLETVHPVAPAFVQRAVVVAVASFVCFLAMMAGFYLRQNIGYFLLSTAFLVVYIFTMFGLVMLKRSVVSIYQNGVRYKKFTAHWNEIASARLASDAKGRKYAELIKNDGEKIVLSETIEGIDKIVKTINEKVDN